MTKNSKTVCIFGGSGFIGRYVTQDLARAGYRIKIATRIPEGAYALKTYGNVGQVIPVQCNYADQESLDAVIEGCDVVINLMGILFEKRKNKFMRVHCDLPKTIAEICSAKNVAKFIHVSALVCVSGVGTPCSKYAKSKLSGEEQILEAYPAASILRPSIVFGPGDSFFNMFAKMAAFLPFLPLIGGGKTKFQPVYVGDVAQAIQKIASEKTNKFEGKTYQLAGPEMVSFKEIYKIILLETNRKRALISVPWFIAKIQGFIFGLFPKPLLTVDQVKSLKSDNVMNEDAQGLEDLDIQPTAMRTILPRYLSNFKKGGPFSQKTSEPKEMNKKMA